MIQTKDKSIVKILKISPINFNLKSENEKYSILNSYKLFLKTCNFDIQILIQSNKEDINKNIEKIKKISEKNLEKMSPKINKLLTNYFQYIKQLNSERNTSTKKFYILIKKDFQSKKINNLELIKEELNSNYLKVKECLERCGNAVLEISSREEIKETLRSFLETKQYLKKFK